MLCKGDKRGSRGQNGVGALGNTGTPFPTDQSQRGGELPPLPQQKCLNSRLFQRTQMSSTYE